MALEGRDWDDELCALMEVPRAHLPEIVDMAGEVGRCDPALLGAAIPNCGLAGDQQSATNGQGCLAVGDTTVTVGTGAFVLTNIDTQFTPCQTPPPGPRPEERRAEQERSHRRRKR